jgi:exonuclease-1
MGIKNLLTIIDVVQKKNLADYKGKRLAIDGYSWIHKCVYNCGHDLVVQNNKSVFFFKMRNKVEQLLAHDIKVILVFDGDKLPSKENTESIREQRRAEKLGEAHEFLKEGNHEKANQKFSESYDVSPQLAYETFEYLKSQLGSKKIECT